MQTHLHSIATVVLLFFLGLLSPGPNFLVVTQTAISCGRVAGFATALGAALGDAMYAGIGLFGVSRLIATHPTMMGIELLGGLYLVWLGAGMLLRNRAGIKTRSTISPYSISPRSHFIRGLATDLANPKTVVCFGSIFAISVTPTMARTVREAMLLAIVLTSITWRSLLSIVFSTAVVRRFYERTNAIAERFFGLALCCFALLLLKRAVS